MKKKKILNFIFFTLILTLSLISLFRDNRDVDYLEKLLRDKKYEEVIKVSEILLKDERLNNNEKKKVYIYKAISEYSLDQKLNAKITFLELISLDSEIKIESAYLAPNIHDYFSGLKNQFLFTNKTESLNSNSQDQVK